MPSIHFICRREGIGLRNVRIAPELGKNIYISGCWSLPASQDPQSLIGGWIYLHPVSKTEPSEMGGVIIAIGPCCREDAAREQGVAFTFESRLEGRGKDWQGASHGMAWTGGIVEDRR